MRVGFILCDHALVVVEGEPGIFPDPIARLFQAISRLFRRKRHEDELPPEEAR